MIGWSSQPLAHAGEFERVRQIVRTAWIERGPVEYSTPGPLDWWRADDPAADLTTQIHLWSRDGRDPEAWTWSGDGELDWFVGPALAADDERTLRTAMLEHHVEWTRAAGATKWTARAVEGSIEAEVVLAAGPEPSDARTMVQMRADLSRLPPSPPLPPEYRIRPVRLPDEREARVDVHRAAFAPSRYTVEKHRALADPGSAYDPSLDLVVVAPDGSFAAMAIGWLDRDCGVGEIEPLGVHPDHRRRGIAAALTHALLTAFRDGGASLGIVHTGDGNAAARRAYALGGFTGAGRRTLEYEGRV